MESFLAQLWPMFSFYTPLKYQKTFGFLVFAGGIEWKQPEMSLIPDIILFSVKILTWKCFGR